MQYTDHGIQSIQYTDLVYSLYSIRTMVYSLYSIRTMFTVYTVYGPWYTVYTVYGPWYTDYTVYGQWYTVYTVYGQWYTVYTVYGQWYTDSRHSTAYISEPFGYTVDIISRYTLTNDIRRRQRFIFRNPGLFNGCLCVWFIMSLEVYNYKISGRKPIKNIYY